ncbi:MAG TPA: cyclase family protein [Gammaproteobacteria bacterium]|nr:cyclase family protein [Gammaproteobacteria bacterium]
MARLWLEHAGQRFAVDPADGVSLAIPLDPHGAQPAHFGAPAARSEPLAAGEFVGDTRAGGSCNCETVTLVPHCNGTHTEGPGHVTRERISVHDRALQPLYLAALVSVAAEGAARSDETSSPMPRDGDRLITARGLAAALGEGARQVQALVVRSLPNDSGKRTRDWMTPPLPPYFSHEAMTLLTEIGVRHLLTDLPSVDRLLDEGRLTGHRVFFGMPPGSNAAADVGRPEATITEMIYVPDDLPDGLYALSLQLACWVGDAAPSRPVLFRLMAA